MIAFHRYLFKPVYSQKAVATIGNFDGMHLGHQSLLQTLKRQAKTHNLTSTVILFEPQPAEFFQGTQAPARLMRLRDKLAYLAAIGIDQVYCLRFNQMLAHTTAVDFVQDFLIKQVKVSQLWVGEDFHFGHQRSGNYHTLQYFADQSYFQLQAVPTYCIDNMRVSSSYVRQALAVADFTLSTKLLGYPYAITGKVIYGQQRGRLWHFPTINMALQRQVPPLHGVYAVKIYQVPGFKQLLGVANIGKRPSIGGSQLLLETHILDFAQDLYGQRLTIEFCQKIRDERYFPELADLRQQITHDVAMGRDFFNKAKIVMI